MMSLPVFTKELNVDVGYGTIACKVWGHYSAKQKFLAFHGFLGNAATFDFLLKELFNKDRCIVCMDYPGHGLSSHLPKGIAYNPSIDLHAMRSVIKHLGWTSAIFMGYSIGAARSQKYALCWPEDVKAIISFDGVNLPLEAEYSVDPKGDGPHDTFAKQIDNLFKVAKDMYGKDPEYELDDIFDLWYETSPELSHEQIIILETQRGARKLANGNYKLNVDPLLRGRINMILQFPVELVTEENRKRLVDKPHLIVMAKNLSKVTQKDAEYKLLVPEAQSKSAMPKLVTVEGSHNIHIYKPEEVAKHIEEFLNELAT